MLAAATTSEEHITADMSKISFNKSLNGIVSPV